MWEYSPHPKIHKDGEQEFKQDFGRTGFIGAGHCSVTDNVTLIIISTIDRGLIKKKTIHNKKNINYQVIRAYRFKFLINN